MEPLPQLIEVTSISDRDVPSSPLTPRSIKRSIVDHFQSDMKKNELEKQLKIPTEFFKELPATHITKKALLEKLCVPPSSPIVTSHLSKSVPLDTPSPLSTGELSKESSANQLSSPIRRLHVKVSRFGKPEPSNSLHKTAIMRQKELSAELEDILVLWGHLIESTICPEESHLLNYLRHLDPSKLLMFGSTAEDLRFFHSQLLQSLKGSTRTEMKRRSTLARLQNFFHKKNDSPRGPHQKLSNVQKFLDIFNDYELSDDEPIPDPEMAKLERTVLQQIGDQLVDFEQLIFQHQIGQGAYSTVFVGSWNQQTLAIKKLKEFTGYKSQLVHFCREVAALKKLEETPNVVKMHGACLFPSACILFEYFEAGSLENYIAANGRLPLEESILMAVSIAKSIQRLHNLTPPLIHRDISLQNILIKKDSTGRWTPFLSDFGISCFEFEDVIPTTGHPRYRPPEVTLKLPSRLGPEVDVYCFGSCLYELFVGEKVGGALSDAQVCALRTQGEIPSIPSSLHPILCDLISGCWAFDPKKRPPFQVIFEQLSILSNNLM